MHVFDFETECPKTVQSSIRSKITILSYSAVAVPYSPPDCAKHADFVVKAEQLPFCLKEYYEIVGESRPLSAFFPKHADFLTEMHF